MVLLTTKPTISWIKVDSTKPDQVWSQTGLEISNRENWILPGCGEESKRNHILPAIYRHAAKKIVYIIMIIKLYKFSQQPKMMQ